VIRYVSIESGRVGPGAPEQELRRGRKARENEPEPKGSGDGRSDESPTGRKAAPQMTPRSTNAPRAGRQNNALKPDEPHGRHARDPQGNRAPKGLLILRRERPVGEMVRRSLKPRRGQLRKACNLEQGDVVGDGGVGGATDNTLKAKRRAQQSRASGCEEPVDERHERMASATRGSRWSSWSLRKERTRGGERP
jgi:hypothetical protein